MGNSGRWQEHLARARQRGSHTSKQWYTMKERRPVGASDDPRPRMEKACERLSEPPEPERARAFWCLPPATFFGFL